MPPGFFLFTAIHRGRSREPGGILMPARHEPRTPSRTPKNPACEAGDSTRQITTEYSMRYPDLLS